jgi:serine/threonine protein kinase
MGIVYRARDRRLERTVALKFLSPEASGDEKASPRFFREAQAAAALNHANICTIYDVCQSEGQTSIAMEYVEGQTFKQMPSGLAATVRHIMAMDCWSTSATLRLKKMALVAPSARGWA